MSRVLGAALVGIDGFEVEVEVRISSLLPRVDIVGLPEASVRESTARVRAAIAAIGHRFPERRVTVNLAPAALRKTGAALDLPIALAILAEAGALPFDSLQGRAFVGELALDGRVRPIRGALALALATQRAGCHELFAPAQSAPEAALARGIEVFAATDLGAVCAHLLGSDPDVQLERAAVPELAVRADPKHCLSDVRGQETAKRALEVSAAGGHGLLLSGPPGSGKTMLALRLPGLLPPLEFPEALEATRIHGAAGRLETAGGIVTQRPFRAPHHTASTAGLLGGGAPPRPGEVSLAHRGVLFLDELPEFGRRTLEALRQVLEDRVVRIARAQISCDFPAHFLLAAAANPCPCGWYRSERRDCRCDDEVIGRYARRLSGPLLDRIDLHVPVPAVSWRDLSQPDSPGEDRPRETSRAVRDRVVAARALQKLRGIANNSEIPDRGLDELVAATREARDLLGRAVDDLGLSARAARRCMRVARTIADLANEPRISPHAMAEALGYRPETRP